MSPERMKSLAREMGPLIGLVLLFIVLAVLNNDFIDPSNLRNLLRQVSINALIAFGMTFVIPAALTCQSAVFWLCPVR